MQPTKELSDAIYLDKVRAAREMAPEQKLLAGPRIFERSCRIMLDGLRHENPGADEPTLQRLLRERLALIRRLEGRDDH